jgi:hypothetical protein
MKTCLHRNPQMQIAAVEIRPNYYWLYFVWLI